jgi:HD-like signal output (HDOD) protein
MSSPDSVLTRSSTPAEHDSALRSACDPDSIELPPLPEIAQRVARLAGGDLDDDAQEAAASVSAVQLSLLIERDVALAAQVMRVANSALYRRGAPVVTLKQAIAWLGMLEVRKIAYGFAVRGELFASQIYRDELTRLWHESVVTALFNQELARAKRRNVESAYLAGLLHRVGFAVILWRLGRSARTAVASSNDEVRNFAAGFEAQVGAQLALQWNLPANVAAGIRHWRRPDAARTDRPDVLQLALARAIATYTIQAPPDAELPRDIAKGAQPWLDELGFYSTDLPMLFAERAKLLATAQSFA